MTYTERALQLRPVIEKASQSLDDSTALTAMELFPKWKDLVQAAAKVVKGFRFQYYKQSGVLYRCIRSSGQPLYHDLSALVGNYVEVV